jgi:hypothetical protein
MAIAGGLLADDQVGAPPVGEVKPARRSSPKRSDLTARAAAC